MPSDRLGPRNSGALLAYFARLHKYRFHDQPGRMSCFALQDHGCAVAIDASCRLSSLLQLFCHVRPINTWNRAAYMHVRKDGEPTDVPEWTHISHNFIMNGPTIGHTSSLFPFVDNDDG